VYRYCTDGVGFDLDDPSTPTIRKKYLTVTIEKLKEFSENGVPDSFHGPVWSENSSDSEVNWDACKYFAGMERDAKQIPGQSKIYVEIHMSNGWMPATVWECIEDLSDVW